MISENSFYIQTGEGSDGMTDQADKIQWHPGFYGAAELELIENKSELEFIREYIWEKYLCGQTCLS